MTDHLMSSAKRSDRLLGNNIIRGKKVEGITTARGASARVVPLLNDLLMAGSRGAITGDDCRVWSAYVIPGHPAIRSRCSESSCISSTTT